MSIRPYPINDAQSSHIEEMGRQHNVLEKKVESLIRKMELASQGPEIIPLYYNFTAASYDPNAKYVPGQVVIVDPSQVYIDAYTLPLNPTMSFTGSNNYSNGTGSVVPGAFVCVKTVPEAWNTASNFISNIVPVYQNAGITPSSDEAQQYRWNGFNNYYPSNPPVADNAWTLTTIGNFTIQTNVCYWKPLAIGSASVTAVGNWNDRGLYNPTGSSYGVGDVVQIGTGFSQGIYQCYYPSNPNAPTSGIGWRLVGGAPQWI